MKHRLYMGFAIVNGMVVILTALILFSINYLEQTIHNAEDLVTAFQQITPYFFWIKALVVTGLLGCIAISILWVIVLTASLVNVIKSVGDHLNEVAHGDMSQTIDDRGKDELSVLSKHYNSFLGIMQGVMQQTKTAVVNVATSSKSISKSIQTIDETLHTQEDMVEEIIASMSQAKSAVETVNNNIHTISQKSAKIDGHMGKAEEMINALVKHTDEIQGVIKIIEEVSEQTSLLALNASIEAARAGDAGRGFSVVADEVRKLASSTNESTSKIRENVINLQKNVVATNEAMQHVQAEVSSIGEELNTLSSLSATQAAAVEAVTGAMNQCSQKMADSTRAVESVVEEVSHLNQDADELNKTIQNFKTQK